MLPYVLGALLLSALSVSADSHTCYKKRADYVTVADGMNYVKCNNTQHSDDGAQLCCKQGDRCGDDSICHTDKIDNGQSSWYIGGCSDPKYDDPVCRTSCSQFMDLWIQWNHTAHIWDCCGDYDCDSNYTSVTFKALSPAEWEPIPQKGNFQPDNDDSNGGIDLSTAAKAGIGVGAGVAVIAVIALVAVCCIRRRKPAARKTFGGSQKGTYERLGPQHEMVTPYTGAGGAQGMPRSRDVSPARGVSPSRAPMMSNYGNVEPPNAAAQATTYPDHLAVHRSTDDGA